MLLFVLLVLCNLFPDIIGYAHGILMTNRMNNSIFSHPLWHQFLILELADVVAVSSYLLCAICYHLRIGWREFQNMKRSILL